MDSISRDNDQAKQILNEYIEHTRKLFETNSNSTSNEFSILKEEHEKLITKYISQLNLNINPTQNNIKTSNELEKTFLPKHKAFLCLSKSKILNIRERLICLNVINNELSLKDKNTLHNKIISSSIHNLNKIKREHENKLYFIQSRTAMNCISFINHQDEEDFRNVLKVKEDECLPDLKELYNSIGDVLRVILLFTNHNNELNFQLTTNELGDILYNKAMPSLGVSNMKELFSQRLVNQEYINNIHKRYRCNDTLETNFLIPLDEMVKRNKNVLNPMSYINMSRLTSFVTYTLSELVEYFKKMEFHLNKVNEIIILKQKLKSRFKEKS